MVVLVAITGNLRQQQFESKVFPCRLWEGGIFQLPTGTFGKKLKVQTCVLINYETRKKLFFARLIKYASTDKTI